LVGFAKETFQQAQTALAREVLKEGQSLYEKKLSNQKSPILIMKILFTGGSGIRKTVQWYLQNQEWSERALRSESSRSFQLQGITKYGSRMLPLEFGFTRFLI